MDSGGMDTAEDLMRQAARYGDSNVQSIVMPPPSRVFTPEYDSATKYDQRAFEGLELSAEDMEYLDKGVLEHLSDMVPTQRQAAVDYADPTAHAGDLASATDVCQRGSNAPAAEEVEILQSKAESVVAKLDEANDLKRKNPYTGCSFTDLIRRISLDQNINVYEKQIPPEKRVQGTVAEQILSVVDCENERHMFRMRNTQEEQNKVIAEMKKQHAMEMENLKAELVREKSLTERECEDKLDKSKASLKGQAEQLQKEGLQSQLESERAKDELAMVNEDVSALKKLLFFWKKKNNVLKHQFDANERELTLAREKLKDYMQIHEMDAYKVHRFCGQLREKEMQSRWKADELLRKNREIMQELIHIKEESKFTGGSIQGDEYVLTHPAQSGSLPLNDVPLMISERPEADDTDLYEKMKSDVNRSRFELSEKCKVLLGIDHADKKLSKVGSCFSKDQAAIAAEVTALNDGIKLRDDQIEVLMSALRFKDQTVEGLQTDIEEKTLMLKEALEKVFEPFHCEDLVNANDSLQRQLNDAKEIIYSMQKQIQTERLEMAEERKVRADRELSVAKERKEKEMATMEKLRDKDTEIIRLRDRLHEGVGTEDSATEVRLVRMEQVKNELQEKVATLEDEKSRLKQYVANLGSRLEQALSQLEHRNQKLSQYDSLAANLTLSPRQVAGHHTASHPRYAQNL